MDPITIPVATLKHAIRQHGGNRSAIASALDLSMNTVRRLIREADLTSMADTLAARSRRPGPRAARPAADAAEELLVIRKAVERMGVKQAAKELRMPVSTVYRRLRG